MLAKQNLVKALSCDRSLQQPFDLLAVLEYFRALSSRWSCILTIIYEISFNFKILTYVCEREAEEQAFEALIEEYRYPLFAQQHKLHEKQVSDLQN